MHDLPQETTDRLSRVTKLLKTQRTLPAQLEAVVAIVKRTISSCDSAGVVLLIAGEPTTAAVTDRLTVEIDLVQYDNDEGPCLAALHGGRVVRIDVLDQDSRFVRFAPGALDKGLNSVLSTPLIANGRSVGALNMYSLRTNAFDAGTEEAVRPLAEYAGEAISRSPLYAYSLEMVDGLLESLASQALIGQATGVLMVTEDETSEDAHGRLRDLALRSGESIRTVAEWVIAERPTRSQTSDPEPTVPGGDD